MKWETSLFLAQSENFRIKKNLMKLISILNEWIKPPWGKPTNVKEISGRAGSK